VRAVSWFAGSVCADDANPAREVPFNIHKSRRKLKTAMAFTLDKVSISPSVRTFCSCTVSNCLNNFGFRATIYDVMVAADLAASSEK
jgi:hypothetical protein